MSVNQQNLDADQVELQIKEGDNSVQYEDEDNQQIDQLEEEQRQLMTGVSNLNGQKDVKKQLEKMKNKDLDDIYKESGVYLGWDDLEYKIDYEKMMEFRKYSHPLNADGEQYECKDLIKNAPTGSHGCCMGTTKNTEFDKLGVGLTLYFRFIKVLIKYYFIFGLIAFPVIIIGIISYNSKSTYQSNFQNSLFSMTLGSIADQNLACGVQVQKNKVENGMVVVDITQNTTSQKIGLDCFGGIVDIESYRFGLVTDSYDVSNKQCKMINWRRLETKCNRQTNGVDNMKLAVVNACQNQHKCQFNFSQSDINSLYFDLNKDGCKEYNDKNIYISAYCKGQVIPLAGDDKLRLDEFSFIAGVIDFLVILGFIYMIINLNLSGTKAKNHVLSNSLSPNLFTIEVRNLPKNLQKDELMGELWNHYEELLNKKYKHVESEEDGIQFKIVDLQICQSSSAMKQDIRYNKLLATKFDIIKSYRRDHDKDKKLPDVCHLSDIKMHYQSSIEEKKKKKVGKIIDKLNKLEDKIRMQFIKLSECENSKPVIKSAWVTFETMRQKDIAMHNIFTSVFNRLIFNIFSGCCFKKYFKKWTGNFKGRLLKPFQPPDPSNIKWENLNYSSLNKFIRKSVSFVITMILIIIALSLMVYFQAQAQRIKEKYPTIDCKTDQFVNTTISQVVSEYKTNKYVGYTNCFCSKNLQTHLNHQFKDANNEQLCYTWLTNEVQMRAYPVGMAILISIINVVLTILFKMITVFERHDYVSMELASKVMKLFISQLINTGLMVLLINARLVSLGVIGDIINEALGGKYMDFDGSWYQDIGTTIMLTMIIQVFSVPITVAVIAAIKKLLRFIDRGCSQDMRKTRKKKQSQYQSLYTGTEFIIDVRYSQILTMSYICMIYSTGMPILYFTTCFQLFMTYWVDKIVIFTFCKKIQNIDHSLQQMVNHMLVGCIFIHTVISIFILGSPNVFYEGVQWEFFQEIKRTLLSQSEVNSTNQSGYLVILFDRAAQPQCYLVTLIFFTFLALLFMRIFLYRPFVQFLSFCFKMCCSSKNDDSKQQYQNAFRLDKFYTFMHKNEVEKEIKLIRLHLNNQVENPNFNALYKSKLIRRKNELQKFLEYMEQQADEFKYGNKFISQSSYDLRHDEKFSELLGISEKMKENIISQYQSRKSAADEQQQQQEQEE